MSVNLLEASEYFNRFYNLALRDRINDPLLHSEWIYFLSMFKTNNVEKDRLELYLSILTSEKHKKAKPISTPADTQKKDIKKYTPQSTLTITKHTETDDFMTTLRAKYVQRNEDEPADRDRYQDKPRSREPEFDFDLGQLDLQKRLSEPPPSYDIFQRPPETNQRKISYNDRDKEREKDRERERQRQREKDREREKEREREREREKKDGKDSNFKIKQFQYQDEINNDNISSAQKVYTQPEISKKGRTDPRLLSAAEKLVNIFENTGQCIKVY